MKKLCKVIPIIALALALTSCSNAPTSVPAPLLISNSNVSSPTTDSLSENSASGILSVPTENSTDIEAESSANGSSYEPINNIFSDETDNSASGTPESDSEFTSTSSVSSSDTTEKLPENEPITKENPGMFDFDSKTVTLNSGYIMPINGLGTYSLTGDTCFDSVTAALQNGVRLIDTAYMYSNEEEVGRAVRDSGIPRGEIFVITKLYPNQFSVPEKAIEQALDKLDIGYIDMMLLHHPGTDDVKAYKAMEKYVESGKVRSLGLSNWYVKELEDFLPQVTIKPALVQNEIHPYYQENDVIPYIQSLGITVQGWYPLGGRGHTSELLGNETISAIAAAHGKSSAQIILRWNLQKGVVVIPGSSNPDHIKENTELYDFKLSDEEMELINALDRGEKHDWY
ncbi:MAG: aldo/keto reductase [Oscillospiraceae bacterium]|nr:aldo/keto reductase [Oscillospiraceae bacterium]